MTKTLSVIIPTYNRALILKTCLEHLEAQTGVDFEVVVVDDGSTDHTPQIVAEFVKRANMTVKSIQQQNALQAAARNRGVREAEGELILFIGDDIFGQSGFLEAHVKAHEKYAQEEWVVLGFSQWDPKLEINPYMTFLDQSGWQFRYQALEPGEVSSQGPYRFFYTSNLSVKKSFFEREWFDEGFTVYGSEDIELGYRLWKEHGMKLFYEPTAKAYHHHVLKEADLPKKMQNIGQSAVYFQKKHPESGAVPSGMKAWVVKVALFPGIYSLLLLFGKMFSPSLYFQLRSRKEFWTGVKKGLGASN